MGFAASRPEQAAIAAVARRYSARWDGRYLVLGGRQVALQIVALRQKATRDDRPRLRFDRVVLRLVADLRTAVSEIIAPDQTVIVTVTAPVRLGGKTAAAIADRIRDGLGRGDVRTTIHGNQVRLRRIADVPKPMPRLIGFVHNAETDPGPILDLTQSFVRGIGEVARKRVSRPSTRDRWLILDARKSHAHIGTYRQIWEQIAIPTSFARLLIVLADGKVQSLTA